MSLPPFLTRIQNAAGPLLSGLGESELGERLSGHSLLLEIDEAAAEDAGQRTGYLLAVNLGARLYPRLSLDAPEALVEEAVALARSINAGCTFGPPPGPTSTLSWRGGVASAKRVTVRVEGWNIALDTDEAATGGANALAAMAATALGIGELFRALFADLLPHGRSEPAPFEINLLTLGEPADIPTLPEQIELGEIHLAGCGAIGQAFVAALRELPLSGKLVAVDHESLDEGNLQRYLLGTAADLGTPKSELVARALTASSVDVEPVSERWGESERSGPGQETVVSALDSKQGRIELQAGLPRELFNAWTQPQDIGVSRHQHFGEESCLACLCWPKQPRPNQSEMIAKALGESELRVLRYLGSKTPVGQPLPAGEIQATGRLALPEDASKWGERSVLQDLIERYGLPPEPLQELAALPIGNLYRDAVCAGMLIEYGDADSRAPDVSVPLAHQSALAGILLATWLVADRVPALRQLRPSATQARYDVLRGGDQVWPRNRERVKQCLCFDPDFLDASRKRWART